ncbi:MAG: homoserine dehydrogenase [Rhizobiales bacterium]|nr:homoserine dehydrogenase [Hyphomicrobiales bacterium]
MTTPLRIGIAGLGTVGGGVLSLLGAHAERINAHLPRPITVTAVSARQRGRNRGVAIDSYRWFDDPVALAESDEVDLFVELIGGEDGPARASVEAAIGRGKPVVTANKALLAHHGTRLARLAEAAGTTIKFEAAVAGGIPIVKTMRESLQGNTIRRVYGILNGTCNFILTAMAEEGRDFAEVLAEAQARGYAEADPTFDIGGFDAAHKLALLTSLAFGTKPAIGEVYIEGIENIERADMEAAAELGYAIKLLGVALATEHGIEQRVHPTMVARGSAIAGVNGVSNCVAVEGDRVGHIMLVGAGAGAGPTASSVVSDILDVARGDQSPVFVIPAAELKDIERAGMKAHEGAYFVRLAVYDRIGAFAAIATRMAEQRVSLESIVQRRGGSAGGGKPQGDGVPMASVVLITHRTTERAIREALAAIETDGHLNGRPQLIRIEDF